MKASLRSVFFIGGQRTQIASIGVLGLADEFYEEYSVPIQVTNFLYMRPQPGRQWSTSFTKSITRLYKARIAAIYASSLVAEFYGERISLSFARRRRARKKSGF